MTKDGEYKPIEFVGKSRMSHKATSQRISDQLYLLSKDKYPELLDDLVITGGHSILVDSFKNDEKENTIKVLGKIYVTQNKYRLPACVDDRTTVYEPEGEYTIYHIALENESDAMNYGIYANGLLVETCSKRFLKYCSNMSLH
jgi:hypothetical protein